MHPLQNRDLLHYLFRMVLPNAVTIPVLRSDGHLVLSHVCSSWRFTVLSHPVFWVNYIFSYRRPCRNRAHMLSVFHAFFHESTGVQLRSTFKRGGCTNIVMDFVTPYVRHLQSLNVVLSLREDSTSLVSFLWQDFSALKVVEITILYNLNRPFTSVTIRDPPPFSGFLNLLADVGNLISSVHSFSPIPSFWAVMTRIDFGLTVISHTRFLEIMFETRNRLEKAHFTVIVEQHPTAFIHYNPLAPIEMIAMLHLVLQIVNSDLHPQFMLLLKFPVIRSLSVERAERHFPFNWELASYVALLSQCNGQLESLRFNLLHVQGHDPIIIHDASTRWPSSVHLANIFHLVPLLSVLDLPFSSRLDATLLLRIAEGHLLPRLKSLRIAGNTDPSLLFDMIRRRNSMAEALPTSARNVSSITFLEVTIPSTNDIMIPAESAVGDVSLKYENRRVSSFEHRARYRIVPVRKDNRATTNEFELTATWIMISVK
ncbi:hypothetical protein CVT26_011610 [Gymnopilus dilepis]|uniref:F-box domain-containing protein n=1 Tax=Gymnopilus dilepis TaxID=231916 RepID=A0A409YQS1_9AGAR|nr:hypothetical protein CVT26_011610 [Gymnopilus dilepis]